MADPEILAPVPNHTIDVVADRMAELSDEDLDFEPGGEPPKAESVAEQSQNQQEPEQDEEPEEQKADEEEAEASEEEGSEDKEAEAAEEEGADVEEGDFLEIPIEGADPAKVPIQDLAELYASSEEIKATKAKIADEQQTFEQGRTEEVERIAQMGQEINERLTVLKQLNIVGDAPNPAMLDPTSQNYDPDNYHLQRAQWEQRKEIEQRINEDIGKVKQFQTAEQKRAYEGLVSAETQKVQVEWPEIVDPGEAGNKARADLLSGASKYYSITKDEIADVSDHRQLNILRDALAYRRMSEKAPEVQKKLASKPRLVKPGTKETKKSRTGRNMAEARKRLKKSGSVGDARALFENFDL